MIKKNQKNIKEYDKRKRVEDIQPPPVYDCPSLSITILYSKVQGKSVPLQAWGGPEGSRNLRFPDFMTTAQEGGKVVSLTHRSHLLPGNSPGTHFC